MNRVALLVVAIQGLVLFGGANAPGLRAGATAKVSIGARSVQARVEVAMTASRGPLGESEYWGTGAGGGRLVRGVGVWINTIRVWMPRSAYADLSNVDSVRIAVVDEALAIDLVGGNGGDHYTCHYVVMGGQLRSRHVGSRSFDAFEETKYVWPSPDEDD